MLLKAKKVYFLKTVIFLIKKITILGKFDLSPNTVMRFVRKSTLFFLHEKPKPSQKEHPETVISLKKHQKVYPDCTYLNKYNPAR
jgi:hypothetical protein